MSNTSYFEITNENYVGTPSGILHTDVPAEQVSWRELVQTKEIPGKEFAFHHEVRAGDLGIWIGEHEVAVQAYGLYNDPPERED